METLQIRRQGTASIRPKSPILKRSRRQEYIDLFSTFRNNGRTPYAYHPLSDSRSIRLMQLDHYDEKKNRLCARLRTFSLNDCPPYQCLSYTWGPPVRTVTGDDPEMNADSIHDLLILPNIGVDKIAKRMAKSIPVTQNLWDALTTMSGPNASQKLVSGGYIWVDAICIAQLDDAEKSSQILLMNDIYGRAENVNVWLSKDTADLDTFLWMHDTLYSALRTAGDRLGFPPSSESLYAWMNRASPLDPHFWAKETGIALSGHEWAQKWKSYRAFYGRRNWFKRAWVVQEIMLAKNFTVSCGDRRLDWDSMMHFYSDIYQAGWYHTLHHDLPMDGFETALSSIIDLSSVNTILQSDLLEESGYIKNYAIFHGAETSLNLWTLLLETFLRSARNRNCTFSEDKVNSLLGMLQHFLPKDAEGLLSTKPEVGVIETYTWIASLCLENACTLFFLNCKEDKSACSIDGLPSWVPDFCARFWPTPLNHVVEIDATCTRKAEHETPKAVGRELHLRGGAVGTVNSKAMIKGEEGDRLLAPCLEFALELDSTYPATGQDRMEVFWRTMLGDSCGVTVEIHPAPNDMGRAFRHFVLMELCGRLRGHHDVADELEETQVSVIPTEWYDSSYEHVIDELRNTPIAESLLPLSSEIRNLAALADRERTSHATMPSEVVRLANLYRVEFQEKYMNRSLFSTSEGHLCLGPPSAQPGDKVFLLEGGRTPYILRKGDGGAEPTYEFLGDCYVHGIMHGEMWTEEFKSNLESIRIA